MRARAKALTALAALCTGLAVAAVACAPPVDSASNRTTYSGGGSSSPSNNNAPVGNVPVQVLLTDDPFPYPYLIAVSLRASKLEIGSNGQYLTLIEWQGSPGVYEVLSLANGKTKSIATKSIPPGHYDRIRFTTPAVKVRVTNGPAFDASAPNGGVLELPIDFNHLPGVSAAVIVDVDVAKSVTVHGAEWLDGRPITNANQIARVSYSPVARAAVVGSGGRIQGTVRSRQGTAVSGATVRFLTREGTQIASAMTDASGVYTVVELPPGSYAVTAEASNQPLTTVQGVPAAAGTAYVVDVTLDGSTTGDFASTPAPPPPPAPAPASPPAPAPAPAPPPPAPVPPPPAPAPTPPPPPPPLEPTLPPPPPVEPTLPPPPPPEPAPAPPPEPAPAPPPAPAPEPAPAPPPAPAPEPAPLPPPPPTEPAPPPPPTDPALPPGA